MFKKLFPAALVGALSLLTVGLMAQTRIAVVDAMKVANESKEGKKIQGVLKGVHDQKQSEINSKEADLKALEEKAKDPKISQEKRDEIQSQFTQKMYEYQAFAKAATDEMENRTQRMQEEFQEKLNRVLTQYAQSKGISLVVEKGICLYNADALDITTEVIAAMNQAYPGA
ncbi:MAG: OmpH family outer membrane protein [Acidobacteriota bacterium]